MATVQPTQNPSIISSVWTGLCKIPETISTFTSPLLRKIQIVWVEGRAVLTEIIPNTINWHLRRKFTNDLQAYELTTTAGKVATLYAHQHPKDTVINEDHPNVLFLHGDSAHPSSLLHLADSVLKANCGRVFSLQLDNSDEDPLANQELIHMGIAKMKSLAEEVNRVFNGAAIVGHSKGAMQGAYVGFVEQSPDIVAIHSISGRLKVVQETGKECHPSLVSMVNSIFDGISTFAKPLYQYVGTEDWNAAQKAMAVKEETTTYVQGAMHLNILFRKEVERALIQNLQAV